MNATTVRLLGRAGCKDSFDLRDFMQRSAVPFEWVELKSDEEARKLPGIASLSDRRLPMCELPGGIRLYSPRVRDLAAQLGFLTKPKLKEYDVSIYGAGPAGLSAAVYAAADGLKTVLIERAAIGGQAGSSSLIENYLGFPEGISGADLADRARQQAVKFGCEILLLREGIVAEFHDKKIHVTLDDGSQLVARTNVCATGVEYQRLGLPNENQFLGNGLIYGAGFSESARLVHKTVYVVGGANSAGQAAMQFSRLADRVVMLVRGSNLSATMSDYLFNRITNSEKISVRFNTEVTALAGDDSLREITVNDKLTGAMTTLPVSELFVCVGGRPNTEWARDLPILRDSLGYLLTGSDTYADGRPPEMWQLKRAPFFLETSVPGSFAAGDVRHGSAKRYATAVGEGGMAVKFVNHILEQET
jgi:thioredoxin reductase (NADPH)